MNYDTMTCGCCNGALPMRHVWEARRNDAGECTGGVDESGRCFAFGDEDWDLHDRIASGETVDLSDA